LTLFNNAISSIKMGVEDYECGASERYISAVRNLYAGILLLAKEAIVRAAPNADPKALIGARLTPVPDGNGGAIFQPENKHTADYVQICRRAKDFGLPLDSSDLNIVRAWPLAPEPNRVENHSLGPNHPSLPLRGAVGAGSNSIL